MNALLGTSPLVANAAPTMKIKSFWKILFIFFLVYGLASGISSAIITVPMVLWMLTEMDFFKAVQEGKPIQVDVEDVMEALPSWFYLLSLFVTVVTIATVLVYCLKMERRSAFSLGFYKKNAVGEYFCGLGIGLAMFGTVVVIMLLSGEATNFRFNASVSPFTVLLFFAGFVIQGASEEILVRSYFMISAAVSKGLLPAILVSSAAFALLHLGNPGISLLAIFNLFLFGVFAGLYFLRRGSIWGIAAIHTIWNFAQGNLFGCKVSGLAIQESVFLCDITGKGQLFSGGAFGPEGGAGVTIVLTLGIVALLFLKNKEISAPALQA